MQQKPRRIELPDSRRKPAYPAETDAFGGTEMLHDIPSNSLIIDYSNPRVRSSHKKAGW